MRTFLSAIVVVLVFTGSAFAQPSPGTATVLVSLPETQRQGSTMSGSIVMPMDVTGIFRTSVQINNADYVDPTNSLWVRVYRLLSDGTWQIYAAQPWKGGARVDDETGEQNPRPWFEVNAEPLRGATLRVELDSVKRLRIGCQLEIVVP
jgi:hypothetical protein